MTQIDLNRLHERIDELVNEFGHLRESIATMTTLCPRHDAAMLELVRKCRGKP